jgi:NlpC/P60 family putative phage cell wall peptidase
MDVATEQRFRDAVVKEAWSWMGTPWRHMGDVKGAAVDCAMLLRMVYMNVGAVEPFDPRPYPRLWFHHHREERMLHVIVDVLGGVEIPVDQARPADLLVYKIGLCYSHSSILVSPRLIVHAYYKNHQVIATETFDGSLIDLPVKAFDMFASRRSA